jgi:hypothetical protein
MDHGVRPPVQEGKGWDFFFLRVIHGVKVHGSKGHAVQLFVPFLFLFIFSFQL